jgi:hypothetical protein
MMQLDRLGFTCLALLLVALTSGLAPLAYASPPDPSWIRGVYDDADGDDAVGLITAGVGSVARPVSADLRPDIVLITATALIDDQPVVSLQPLSRQPRGPPAA